MCIKTIDGEECIYRDLGDFDIEISGVKSPGRNKRVCAFICVWDKRDKLDSFMYSRGNDSLTRIIFTLRCVNGMSWAQVAEYVGGGNTEEGVKHRFYRELRKTKCQGGI